MSHPISGSAAWFFVIILKFIFESIFDFRIYEKKFLDRKEKFLFEAQFSLNKIYLRLNKIELNFSSLKVHVQKCSTPSDDFVRVMREIGK